MELIRLQKFISDCGIMSRRAAEEEIKKGRVTVNGLSASLGDKVDPQKDTVMIGKTRVMPRGGKKYVYLMLNKPVGYITTMSDDRGRKCVADLVADVDARVYPIGRLDFDSEGLLLLTDDGQLANKLMHPSGHIPKVYHVKTDVEVSPDVLKRLSMPFEIDGYTTKSAECSVVSMKNGSTVVRIVLNEGRNRQIRKMFDQLGLNVISLKRVSIGEINLGNLKSGTWRKLSLSQINYLKKYKQGNNKC